MTIEGFLKSAQYRMKIVIILMLILAAISFWDEYADLRNDTSQLNIIRSSIIIVMRITIISLSILMIRNLIKWAGIYTKRPSSNQ